MPISRSPPPLISVPRITTLIASLIVATGAATKYVSRDSSFLKFSSLDLYFTLFRSTQVDYAIFHARGSDNFLPQFIRHNWERV